MPFFKSFWRETGKNTGKWASNKVFGDAWSTPFRFMIRRDSTHLPKATRTPRVSSHRAVPHGLNRPHSEGENSDAGMHEQRAAGVDARELFLKAEGVQFNGEDIQELTKQLDAMLLAAHEAEENRVNPAAFLAKIRSGILRLEKLGDTVSADFYRREVMLFKRSRRLAVLIPILLFIASVGFLFYLGHLDKKPAWTISRIWSR